MPKKQTKVFRLVVELENEIFQNGPSELARLLRETASKVEKGKTDGKLMDENGNSVGKFAMNGELI